MDQPLLETAYLTEQPDGRAEQAQRSVGLAEELLVVSVLNNEDEDASTDGTGLCGSSLQFSSTSSELGACTAYFIVHEQSLVEHRSNGNNG